MVKGVKMGIVRSVSMLALSLLPPALAFTFHQPLTPAHRGRSCWIEAAGCAGLGGPTSRHPRHAAPPLSLAAPGCHLGFFGPSLATSRRLLSPSSGRGRGRQEVMMMRGSGDGDGAGKGDEDLDARILAIALPALGALAIDPLLGVVCLSPPEKEPPASSCCLLEQQEACESLAKL